MTDQPSKLPFRRSTLIVTNAIKTTGLGIAVHEAFWIPQPRTVELALAAFMMAGAQISEELVLRLAARFLGGQDPTDGAKP